MNQITFYQWHIEICNHFSNLKKWQALGLAISSFGIIKARHSQASIIAEEIPEFGKASTVERRLQRWKANPRIPVGQVSIFWTQWVLENYEGKIIFLLRNQSAAQEIAENGYVHVINNFNWNSTTVKLERLMLKSSAISS